MSAEHSGRYEAIQVSFPLDERPGPARGQSAAEARVMVERALDAWQSADAGRGGGVPWRALAMAAAVLLGVVGSAAAAYVWVARTPDRPPQEGAVTQPSQGAVGRNEPRSTTSEAAPPEPEPPIVEKAPPEPEPPIVEKAPAVSEPPPEPRQPEAERNSTPATEKTRPAQPRPQPSAEDWMRRANRLRTDGEWSRAERAYRRVYREHPRSLAAYVARVAAASLRLEHLGDPRGARRVWQRARDARPGGSLDVEILQGIAESSRQLGELEREARALRTLVESHPGTRAAQRATKRLEPRAAGE